MIGFKVKSIAAWTLQILFAIFFTFQAAMKLGASPHWVSRFRVWGYPEHFYFVVGLCELLGAILLLIPRLARWGAVLLLIIMTGATATHVINREPQVVTTVLIMILLSALLYLCRRGSVAS